MDTNYHAYMLRLQRNQSATHWRATLENAHTGELLRFTNEIELLLYLRDILHNECSTKSTDYQEKK